MCSGDKDFPHDAWDDVSSIPLQTTHNSLIYTNADKALKNDSSYPDNTTTSIVGHSFGGSVVSEMQKQFPDRTFKTTTYGAHVSSMTTPDNSNNKRFRTYGDVISVLDRGATMSVKIPKTIIKFPDIKSQSTVVVVVNKDLDNHRYDNFTEHKLYNTSQDTFVYTTDQ